MRFEGRAAIITGVNHTIDGGRCRRRVAPGGRVGKGEGPYQGYSVCDAIRGVPNRQNAVAREVVTFGQDA